MKKSLFSQINKKNQRAGRAQYRTSMWGSNCSKERRKGNKRFLKEYVIKLKLRRGPSG
jgi:hypothetical protein